MCIRDSNDASPSILSPLISDDELSRLGGEQHILQGAPVPSIKSSDLCDGLLCYQSFTEIGLRYPWEGKTFPSSTNSSGWAVRRKLMSVLGFNTASLAFNNGKTGAIAGIQKKKLVSKPASVYFKSTSVYSNNSNSSTVVSCRPYQSQVQVPVSDNDKAYSKYFNAPIKAVSTGKPNVVIAVSPKADEFLYDVEDDAPDVSKSSLNSTAVKDHDNRVTFNTVTPDLDITIPHTNISSPLNTLEKFAFKQAHSTVKGSESVVSNKENISTAFSRLIQVKRKPETKNVANKKQKKGTTAVPLKDKNTIQKFLFNSSI